PSLRYQTATELENDLRSYLKTERIVIPQSGIAGLLKRVVGSRIEQRRKAVRGALKSIAAGVSLDLISNEPVFTPTGREKVTISGVSVVTGTGASGISGHSTGGSRAAPPSTRSVSYPDIDPNRGVAIVAYAVGVAGILIAIAVLYLNAH
ncbi:MAG TPA: hypothetical protein VGK73_10225, partial [Polyangiaceae bacterium]